MSIDKLLIKVGSAGGLSEKAKWENVLNSKDVAIIQEAQQIASSMLEKNQGLGIFKELLYSTSDTVVQNTIYITIRFSSHNQFVNFIKTKGTKRLLDAIRSSPENMKIYGLSFIGNIALQDATIQDMILKDNGLKLVVDIINTSSNSNLKNIAAGFISVLVNGREESQDWKQFSSPEYYEAFKRILKDPEGYEEPTIINILLTLTNIITQEINCRMFSDSGGIEALFGLTKRNNSHFKTAILSVLRNVFLYVQPATIAVDIGFLDFVLLSLNGEVESAREALGTITHLALHDGLLDKCHKFLQSGGLMKSLSQLLATSKQPEIRLLASQALSNLMLHEKSQELLLSSKQVSTIVSTLKNEPEEQIQSKIVNSLFNMTVSNEPMRVHLAQSGFNDIVHLAHENKVSPLLKTEIVKTMINLSLSDEPLLHNKQSISILLDVISTSKDTQQKNLASVALENMSYGEGAIDKIRDCGGYEASVQFLKTANDSSSKERSCLLLSRFATNGILRRQYQQDGISKTLEKMRGGNDLEEAIKLATLVCNTPTVQGGDDMSKENYADLKDYQHLFEEEDDIFEYDSKSIRNTKVVSPAPRSPSNVLRASSSPAREPQSVRSPVSSKFSNNIFIQNDRNSSSPKPEEGRKFSRPIQKPTNSNSPQPAKVPTSPSIPENEESKIEDHSIPKEYYTIKEENNNKKTRKTILSRVSSLFIKGSEPGQKGDTGNGKTACEAVLWDFVDHWCTSCSKSQGNCERSLSDARAHRNTLLKDGVRNSYNEDTKPKQDTSSKTEGGTLSVSGSMSGSLSASFSKKHSHERASSSTTDPRNPSNVFKIKGNGNNSLTSRPKQTRPSILPPQNSSIEKHSSLPDIPPGVDPERFQAAKIHFRRTKIAQELLHSEGDYVKSLGVMIFKFKKPLEQLSTTKKPLMSPNHIRTIFSSIEILYGYSSMLLDAINQKLGRWHIQQKLGDVFLFMGDFFKVYTDYINNYDQAVVTIGKLCSESDKLEKWLEKRSLLEVCENRSLSAFLAIPLQRLSKYLLLLKELLKSTPEKHPDERDLALCVNQFEKITDYLTKKKKEASNQYRMLELTENLVGSALKMLLQPTRHYVHGEEVFWVEVTPFTGPPRSSSTPSCPTEIRGMLFLFNDALCYTTEEANKKAKTKQRIEQVLLLNAAKIQWRDLYLVLHYESIKSHLIEFRFQNPKAALVTKNFLLEVQSGNETTSATSVSLFKKQI